MNFAFQVFYWSCIVLGAALLFALILWSMAQVVYQTIRYIGEWHRLVLLLAIKVRVRDYRDRLFWQAVKEHINGSSFAAKIVADFAHQCAPFDKDTDI